MMNNQIIAERFRELATPLIADACVRLDIPLRLAPFGIRPVAPNSHIAGCVLPVRHFGSVDVFLEAMMKAKPGDILVIDNENRKDEGCIGDLTVLEGWAAGLAAFVVWGCHRDTEELIHIGFPVFSYGSCPAGPLRAAPRSQDALVSACVGNFTVSGEDVVFADADGVIFVPYKRVKDVLAAAQSIRKTERRQARDIDSGNTLRIQLKFEEFLKKREEDPSYTFRKHLRSIGAAIEE